MTTVYQILSEREGPGPGPLVQNMVNIGPRPGAPRSQRVKESEACEGCLSGEQVTPSCGRWVKVLHFVYGLNKNMPVIVGRMKNS